MGNASMRLAGSPAVWPGSGESATRVALAPVTFVSLSLRFADSQAGGDISDPSCAARRHRTRPLAEVDQNAPAFPTEDPDG